MPTPVQPSMDLQDIPNGMGPAMMRLDTASPVDAPEMLTIEEWMEWVDLYEQPVEIPAYIKPPTRWQRLWALLNRDVMDIWSDIKRRINAARTR